ncbi:MAG: hypothetical protein J6T16_04820, partial [Opitutales bacterium]|nr:hypothetical protein [Opitutales bacterium]
STGGAGRGGAGGVFCIVSEGAGKSVNGSDFCGSRLNKSEKTANDKISANMAPCPTIDTQKLDLKFPPIAPTLFHNR